jgi:hypothetical protein
VDIPSICSPTDRLSRLPRFVGIPVPDWNWYMFRNVRCSSAFDREVSYVGASRFQAISGSIFMRDFDWSTDGSTDAEEKTSKMQKRKQNCCALLTYDRQN